MPHVAADVDSLVTTPPKPNVGTGQCVALVEAFSDVRRTAATTWKVAAAVRGNLALKRGTAIATFVNGRYLSRATGNHAAFYVSQDARGIWVVDQFALSRGIRKRFLRFQGKDSKGNYVDPSDDGDAFSVIE